MTTRIQKSRKTQSKSSTRKHKLTPETQPLEDIYSRVTNKIIADLEKGNLTWRQPWNSEFMAGNVVLPLRWNDIPYTGINTIILWATATEKGYILPHWMTFKQAADMKANIRKGEKSTQIVYADHLLKEEEAENGELETVKIPYLKAYNVFNVSQIEGLPEAYYTMPEKPVDSNAPERIAELEAFFAATKADIRTGTKAYYNQTTDQIQMPPFESFQTANDYYSILSHEITHWTKHPSRLNRDFGRKKYGDEGYAMEELVAELGACFLGASLGFEPMPEEHHALYIQSWLQALKDDKKLIFSAASHAQRATAFISTLTLNN